MTAKDLKNALLQEAVQGKLVPQIASEGNARDLLEEIRKERLSHGFANSYGICDGKDKKTKKSDLRSKSQISVTKKELPEITEDEIPFEIPESWCWCRLGEVTEIARGGSPRPIKDYLTTDEDGYNWIKIGDTDKDGKYINRTAEKIKKEGLNKTRFVHKGDFLLTNSMSFGRPYILNIDGCIHDGWLVISPKDNIFNKDFLYYVLSSTFAYNQFCDSVSGAVVKNLNSDKVRESLFPLPPLAEQKRIVAAIEKFMPLIEEYGKKETELKAFNEQIGTLTKKAILQEAVQGKLVPQIAAEGNAKDLLEEIKKEKAKLIKEGKIKKEKPLPEITEDEIPFDIPETWCWCRFGDIFQHNTGKTQNSSVETKNGELRKFITTSNLYWNEFDFTKVKEMLFSENELQRCTVTKGDLLICEGGEYGRSAIWTYDYDVCFQNHVHRARSIKENSIYVEFYYYLIFLYKNIGFIEGRGVGIKSLSTENLHQIIIPLPPLEEQKRIVAAIEKMLPLCEKLGE